MKCRGSALGLTVTGVLLAVLHGCSSTAIPSASEGSPQADEELIAHPAPGYEQPMVFVPNQGQWDHPARYVGRSGPLTVLLEEAGWTFALVDREQNRGASIRLSFANASEAMTLCAERPLPGKHHYLTGSDSSRWKSGVATYRAVRLDSVYDGIDLRAYQREGRFEYDVLVAPGADLSSVEIEVEGIDGLSLEDDGSLLLSTPVGPVRLSQPKTWLRCSDGSAEPLASRYSILAPRRFGFEVPEYDATAALVVDPGLIYSTFLGTTSSEEAWGLALAPNGELVVVGHTGSAAFPTTPGGFDPTYNGGGYDVFVTRLSADGASLIYSTYLGGASFEWATAVAVDATGAATVVGYTHSADFPTTAGAYDRTYNGNQDGFVARLQPWGGALAYSTFLGGTGSEEIMELALSPDGAVTLVGATAAASFPTTAGAFDRSLNGNWDAFVTKLNPTGSGLVYSTFLGGSLEDRGYGIGLSDNGQITVAGFTDSSNFPATTGSYDRTHNGNSDAFVARLSSTGASLIYSTFVGGSDYDSANSLAVDPNGAAIIAGYTGSSGFPATFGAFDTGFNGGHDGFLARLAPAGNSLDFATFFGGSRDDVVLHLVLGPGGDVTMTGYTASQNLPTSWGAYDRGSNGDDAFVARLDGTGSELLYGTYLGGSGFDASGDVALDSTGAALVAGFTMSSDFPTTPAAFDGTSNGGSDVFVTHLDMLPVGVTAYGASTPGCDGALAIGVRSWPQVGESGFAITCNNAAPNASGGLATAAGGLTTPIAIFGVDLWIDPYSAFVVVGSARADAQGNATFPLPIPNIPTLTGASLVAQYIWVGPTSPPSCPPQGISTSNALEVVIQR